MPGLPRTMCSVWDTTLEWRQCRSFRRLEKLTRKVRVWITQIRPSETWWENLFSSFCTKKYPFLRYFSLFLDFLECPKMGSNAYFFRGLRQNRTLKIRVFSAVFTHCREYSKNAEISDFGVTRIFLSRLFAFCFVNLAV